MSLFSVVLFIGFSFLGVAVLGGVGGCFRVGGLFVERFFFFGIIVLNTFSLGVDYFIRCSGFFGGVEFLFLDGVRIEDEIVFVWFWGLLFYVCVSLVLVIERNFFFFY